MAVGTGVVTPEQYRGPAGWCLSCAAGEAALQVVASVRQQVWPPGDGYLVLPWVVSAVAVLWPQGRREPRKS